MLFTTDRWDRECMHTEDFQTAGLESLHALALSLPLLVCQRHGHSLPQVLRILRVSRLLSGLPGLLRGVVVGPGPGQTLVLLLGFKIDEGNGFDILGFLEPA